MKSIGHYFSPKGKFFFHFEICQILVGDCTNVGREKIKYNIENGLVVLGYVNISFLSIYIRFLCSHKRKMNRVYSFK